VPVGGVHADGLEKMLAGVLAQGHSGEVFREDGHQEISAVAVQEFGSGFEIEALLAVHHGQGLLVGGGIVQTDISE